MYISESLSLVIVSLQAMYDKLNFFKSQNIKDEEILAGSIQQIAFAYSFLQEKDLMNEYMEYAKKMEKEYSDFQILKTRFDEINE